MTRLNSSQLVKKTLYIRGEVGTRMDESKSGINGKRKRGSWWGIMESIANPESAEARRMDLSGAKRRGIEGPRRRGRLISRCW